MTFFTDARTDFGAPFSSTVQPSELGQPLKNMRVRAAMAPLPASFELLCVPEHLPLPIHARLPNRRQSLDCCQLMLSCANARGVALISGLAAPACLLGSVLEGEAELPQGPRQATGNLLATWLCSCAPLGTLQVLSMREPSALQRLLASSACRACLKGWQLEAAKVIEEAELMQLRAGLGGAG